MREYLVYLALRLRWREWSVVFLLLSLGRLSPRHVGLVELGQEPVPVLLGQGGVLHQLSLDHQCLGIK